MNIFDPKADAAAFQGAVDELIERAAERLAPIAAKIFDGYTVTITIKVDKKPEA